MFLLNMRRMTMTNAYKNNSTQSRKDTASLHVLPTVWFLITGTWGYDDYVDLRAMGTYDWRLADTNVWKVERMLLDYPHRAIRSPDRHVNALRARYRAFKRAFPDRKPLFYDRRDGGRAAGGELVDRQSRSKSRAGLVIGSPSPGAALPRIASTAHRRAFFSIDRLLEQRFAPRRLSARMRCASLSSGLSPRSGSLCPTTRPRLVSMTSVAWQQGHVTSISDFSRDMYDRLTDIIA